MRILLKNRSLLKISGNDAEEFLQNQFTNDIKKLDSKNVQFNAYCQHQGKVIAFFWVMRMDEDFLLSFPDDLLEKVKSRLQMFVIMSDVIIEDISDSYSQIGLINEMQLNSFCINDKLSILIEARNNQHDSIMKDNHAWTRVCIDSLLPDVYSITSEKFVPQMLNLDIDEIGVNFSKGCYPGQEVVARSQYRGAIKRRLYLAQVEIALAHAGPATEVVHEDDPNQPAGMVVLSAQHPTQTGLVTLQIECKSELAQSGKLHLGKADGPALQLGNLPYSLIEI